MDQSRESFSGFSIYTKRMKNLTKLIFILLLGMLNPAEVFAAITPVSVSIVPPLQFPPEDFSVTGVRGSLLWGRHRDLYGIDLGILGNITEQTFVGVGISGIFNYTKGSTTILGLQLAGLGNYNTNKTNVFGLQAALGMNYNTAASTITGVQLSLVNMSEFTTIYGLQVGVYNTALEVYGIQIGLVNVAKNLHGIQIGLLNFNAKGPFIVSPLLNVGF